MNRTVCFALGAVTVSTLAGSALALIPNGVTIVTRIFNDYPTSTLTVSNNYPSSVIFDETNFGTGGFANRHSGYFSTDGGATAHDFGYSDAFDLSFSMSNTSSPPTGRESGFQTDLFGFGFFGPLPHNGEIAAFGSILPFQSFGTGLWTPGQAIGLRMIYRPGDGDGVNPLPPGGNPSTMEYIYDLGSGPVSSGLKPFTNLEGGVPQNFSFLVGFGVQNQGAPGGTAHTEFRNFVVPAPGAGLAVAGFLGLASVGRRRRR